MQHQSQCWILANQQLNVSNFAKISSTDKQNVVMLHELNWLTKDEAPIMSMKQHT